MDRKDLCCVGSGNAYG